MLAYQVLTHVAPPFSVLNRSRQSPLRQRWFDDVCNNTRSVADHGLEVAARMPTDMNLPDAQGLPLKHETAKEGTDEDADDDVAIVVHGEPVYSVRRTSMIGRVLGLLTT